MSKKRAKDRKLRKRKEVPRCLCGCKTTKFRFIGMSVHHFSQKRPMFKCEMCGHEWTSGVDGEPYTGNVLNVDEITVAMALEKQRWESIEIKAKQARMDLIEYIKRYIP